MAQVLGRAFIYVSGKLLRTKEGAKLANISGVERKPVVGNQVDGYTESAVPPTIECTISLTKDVSLTELAKAVNETVTFEGDNGKTFVLHEAFLENAMDLTSGSGEVTLKYVGVRCEEM